MEMDTIKLDSVYVPTLKEPMQMLTLSRPCQSVMQRVQRRVAEYKTAALLVIAKLVSVGKSIIKYLKKDFLKKEGVPLKGVVVYKGAAKGVGKIVNGAH